MNTIVINNQKGGVGKTTLAVHLAWFMAEAGRRVLMIDVDAQGNATDTLKQSYRVDLGGRSLQAGDADCRWRKQWHHVGAGRQLLDRCRSRQCCCRNDPSAESRRCRRTVRYLRDRHPAIAWPSQRRLPGRGLACAGADLPGRLFRKRRQRPDADRDRCSTALRPRGHDIPRLAAFELQYQVASPTNAIWSSYCAKRASTSSQARLLHATAMPKPWRNACRCGV